MSLLQFLFGFQGRIRRLHLWLFYIGLSAVVVVFVLLLRTTVIVDHGAKWTQAHGIYQWHGHGYSIVTMYAPWLGLAALLAAWMKLAVLVKRWHDRDKSGWWVLIALVPLIGPIWQMIECFFLDGTQGPNKYGLSPKGIS
ncbi:MAG TPA: DUF805 domain-containing protein [Asticcacaulis sp.]|nr:DUF805 domain-containing protein [Asticcacaulis sp.]